MAGAKDAGARLGAILLLVGLCSACGEKSASPAAGAAGGISFARQVQPILDAHCVQCHVREAPQGGLVLEEGMSYGMMVGKKSAATAMDRVKPGDPQNSYLLHKLNGTQAQVKGTGLGMPLVEGVYQSLPSKDIETVRKWIEAGAPDN